jgi:hypothetical protein
MSTRRRWRNNPQAIYVSSIIGAVPYSLSGGGRMSPKLVLPLVAGLATIVIPFSRTVAQWSTDPTVNNQICTAVDTQAAPFIVADNVGGTIIVWEDRRNGLNYDIYSQHITSAGAVQWTPNGIVVSSAPRNQRIPFAVSDGAGGAIIAWHDFRSDTADIYAQRLNVDGAPQWTSNGLLVCNAPNDQRLPRVVRSGIGNAIIAWQDKRSGSEYDIYAQRVSAAGATVWTPNGVAVCTAAGDQDDVRIIGDGEGGAIVAWQDHRNGNDYDIYAQHISIAGTALWSANGVAIVRASGDQLSPRMAPDGAKGAVIVWQDHRNGNDYDIYAQRIDSTGTIKWQADGIPIATGSGSQDSPIIEADSAGNAIIAWEDRRNGTDYDIYAQRISSSGIVLWTTNGISVTAAPSDQTAPRIGSDGAGGAVIVWQDQRSGTAIDIYAQRVDSTGALRWTSNGVGVSTAANNQQSPTLVSNGAQGATIAWEDYRNGTDFNIFAQHMNADGSLGGITAVEPAVTSPSSFSLRQNYPDPFNPSTTIGYVLPQRSEVTLSVYNALGQQAAVLSRGVEEAGYHEVRFDGSELASGVYFYRLTAGTNIQTRKMLLLR